MVTDTAYRQNQRGESGFRKGAAFF